MSIHASMCAFLARRVDVKIIETQSEKVKSMLVWSMPLSLEFLLSKVYFRIGATETRWARLRCMPLRGYPRYPGCTSESEQSKRGAQDCNLCLYVDVSATKGLHQNRNDGGTGGKTVVHASICAFLATRACHCASRSTSLEPALVCCSLRSRLTAST